MEHLATCDLSEYQLYIIKKRLKKKKTYKDICSSFYKKFQIKIYDNRISKSIKRAVMGYPWSPGMPGGVDPYLYTDDFNELKDDVKNTQECGYPMDCSDVIDEAQRLKMNRIQ